MTRTFSPPATPRTILAATVLTSALITGGVQARGYTGPRSGTGAGQQGYAGPSSVEVTTVKELADKGKDDQNAILRGRIVSHDGGEHYTFDDGTGRIRVEIYARKFPADRQIDDKVTVELVGELDRDRNSVEFDVDQIRIP